MHKFILHSDLYKYAQLRITRNTQNAEKKNEKNKYTNIHKQSKNELNG